MIDLDVIEGERVAKDTRKAHRALVSHDVPGETSEARGSVWHLPRRYTFVTPATTSHELSKVERPLDYTASGAGNTRPEVSALLGDGCRL